MFVLRRYFLWQETKQKKQRQRLEQILGIQETYDHSTKCSQKTRCALCWMTYSFRNSHTELKWNNVQLFTRHFYIPHKHAMKPSFQDLKKCLDKCTGPLHQFHATGLREYSKKTVAWNELRYFIAYFKALQGFHSILLFAFCI